MVVASLGVVVTSYVIFVFIKFRDTPVVRASGQSVTSQANPDKPQVLEPRFRSHP